MNDKRKIYSRLLNSTRWRATRNMILSSSPICEDCRKAGRVGMATEVHHIVAVESAATPDEMERLCFDRGNLVGLCRVCHRERHLSMGRCTKEENARRKRAEAEAFLARFGGGKVSGS